MHKLSAALGVTSLAAVLVPACASRHVTSLPGDKPISSLSPDDQRTFCEDRIQYMSSRVSDQDRQKIHCSLAAGGIGDGPVDTGRARAACSQIYQACMSVPAQEEQTSCTDFVTNASSCQATVDEASSCAEAQADALQEMASKADDVCKDIGRSSHKWRDAQDRNSKLDKACGRVQTLCPKLFVEPALEGTTVTVNPGGNGQNTGGNMGQGTGRAR
jgi:hypothetical protein